MSFIEHERKLSIPNFYKIKKIDEPTCTLIQRTETTNFYSPVKVASKINEYKMQTELTQVLKMTLW